MIPGSGRSPGEGNGCPLQYSCLENSMDRGAWRARSTRSQESDTTEQSTLSLSFTFSIFQQLPDLRITSKFPLGQLIPSTLRVILSTTSAPHTSWALTQAQGPWPPQQLVSTTCLCLQLDWQTAPYSLDIYPPTILCLSPSSLCSPPDKPVRPEMNC